MTREKRREQFPLLASHDELVYLDSAATTQQPWQVLNEVDWYLRHSYANVHRSLYRLGAESTGLYEGAREKVRKFLNAESREEIIFTSGTTAAINLLSISWSRGLLKKGDRILLSGQEHHSNLVPWQLAAELSGAELDFIPLKEDGDMDLDNLEDLLTERTGLVAVTALSNVLGTVTDLDKIIRLAHNHGIPVLVDAAQAAARIPLDVRALDCDFLALSGHKMYGPTGIGVLYGKKEWLKKMPPFMGGGEMISRVEKDKSSWNALPYKFEAGTPPVAGVIGLGAAVDFLERHNRQTICDQETELAAYAREKLSAIPEVEIYGPKGKQLLGVLSFNLKNIHAHDTAQILDSQGIAVRAGHHCAQPLIRHLKAASTCRISFGCYNTIEDVDFLINGLQSVRSFFKGARHAV